MTTKNKAANKPITSSATANIQKRTAAKKKPDAANLATISVGGVNVQVHIPNKIEIKKRIVESKSVAGRLKSAISHPGIKLKVKSTTPLYFADNSDPTLVVQKVGNKTMRGRFNKNGVFVKVK